MAKRRSKSKVRKGKIEDARSGPAVNLKCECGRWVFNVHENCTEVKCWRCTTNLAPIKPVKKLSDGYPKNWDSMERFVHTDGSVYELGELVPELFGKFEASPVKVPIKRAPKPKKPRVKKVKNDITLETVEQVIKQNKKIRKIRKNKLD